MDRESLDNYTLVVTASDGHPDGVSTETSPVSALLAPPSQWISVEREMGKTLHSETMWVATSVSPGGMSELLLGERGGVVCNHH